jgi:hypothetical protein
MRICPMLYWTFGKSGNDAPCWSPGRGVRLASSRRAPSEPSWERREPMPLPRPLESSGNGFCWKSVVSTIAIAITQSTLPLARLHQPQPCWQTSMRTKETHLILRREQFVRLVACQSIKPKPRSTECGSVTASQCIAYLCTSTTVFNLNHI